MKPLYKILIAIGAVLVIGGGLYFAWWLFIDEPVPEAPPVGGVLPGDAGARSATSTAPGDGASVSAPRAISDHKSFDYWLVPGTGEVYYLTPEGHVYVVKEGPDLEISRQTISALNKTEPSQDGRRLLAAFGNPSSPQWGVFDTVDSVWRPLPREIVNAGWGRNSSELIATVTSGNDMNLSFVDVAKNPPTYTVIIRDFRMEDVVLSTLDNGDVLVVERPSSRSNGRVWRINPSTRAVASALPPTAGRVVKVMSGKNMSYIGSAEGFFLADGVLQNAFPLFFNTLPDKCAVAESTTYCFAPKNFEENTVLPDAYYMRSFYSDDGLYAITHGSLAITPVPLGLSTYDADKVSADEKAVYFVDRYTDTLFALSR